MNYISIFPRCARFLGKSLLKRMGAIFEIDFEQEIVYNKTGLRAVRGDVTQIYRFSSLEIGLAVVQNV